ncbi:hypothetical protein [Stigmatella aurantiaca]|uniref:Conserved uncharacterized protein n=1 Tax=Stigmatella aurantiaca (strain DW4/3-1) TaxID=378806 RepID=Q08UC1_STIAD|nr:hypothetical protein [Stigmatella aurantiaca]ADO69127.1 conserved uncharacterized protein [Stigmatella aurantiaca DW4/3-1]EAU64086.1 conserved hypothetical protein [Stigmatella aurantiaca DW4/3-1]
MQPRIFVTEDDTDWQVPLGGPGLLLDVPAEAPWRQRPQIHVEATRPYLLRMAFRGQPLFWLRVDIYWDGCAVLRGPSSLEGSFPRITTDVARRMGEPGTTAWWTQWLRWWIQCLQQPESLLLHTGRWCLRPLQTVPTVEARSHPTMPTAQAGERPAPPHALDAALKHQTFWTEDWRGHGFHDLEVSSGSVLALRAPSAENDGRVKAFRKQARDGTLPPVLLFYFALVGKWLVVDGHDRLHAARLENRTPPLLGLWSVFEQPVPQDERTRARQQGSMQAAEFRLRGRPMDVDAVNRLLVRDHESVRRFAGTRGYPLRGGGATWRAEVAAWKKGLSATASPDDWAAFVE